MSTSGHHKNHMQRMQHTQDCSGSVGGRGNGLCSVVARSVLIITEGYLLRYLPKATEC